MRHLIFKVLFLWLLFFAFLGEASEKIDINTASPEELQAIKGVGPVIAQKIIDARPFSSIDDLIKIKGIGEKKLADIKNEGLACVCSQKEELKKEFTNEELADDGRPQNLATVSEQLPGSSNSILVMLAALFFAIFSGTAIIALKKSLILYRERPKIKNYERT
ncbi:MAG: helix-hairpin-helix domain-containing protein [Candidatus Nealsonbacteria bacterium]|nr:helix-hairpin-helix domain-containing protein [Candidatus Nealsonbacteria bacterium]